MKEPVIEQKGGFIQFILYGLMKFITIFLQYVLPIIMKIIVFIVRYLGKYIVKLFIFMVISSILLSLFGFFGIFFTFIGIFILYFKLYQKFKAADAKAYPPSIIMSKPIPSNV